MAIAIVNVIMQGGRFVWNPQRNARAFPANKKTELIRRYISWPDQARGTRNPQASKMISGADAE
jgi:hypothetical protein